MLKEQMSKKSF